MDDDDDARPYPAWFPWFLAGLGLAAILLSR